MSCDAVAFAAVLWLTAAPEGSATAMIPEHAVPPPAVAYEPLFADILKRAGALKVEVEGFRTARKPVTDAFKRAVGELAALDMRGHVTLKQRGTDGDLKCILKGIAEDLPLKLQALEAAGDAASRDAALREMAYLLNDNVEVITAPPAPPV